MSEGDSGSARVYIGIEIRVWRERAGFTLEAAAHAVGLLPEQLEAKENGLQSIEGQCLYRLMNLYKVTNEEANGALLTWNSLVPSRRTS